jgi:hypothetical protein
MILVPVNNVLDNVQYLQNNIKDCQRNKTLRNRIHAQSREQTFLNEVSIDVFLILQQESDFIAAKGLMWTKLWKEIIC